MNDDLEFIKITTSIQARFNLMKREVITFELTDGIGYIHFITINNVIILIQPDYGKSIENKGNLKMAENFVHEHMEDSQFYVCKGSSLATKKFSLLDKFADFLDKDIQS